MNEMALNLCFSGGAKGWDALWGRAARAAGHHARHFSFAGHRVHVPAEDVVTLTRAQLEAAEQPVRRAAERLGKYPPSREPAWSLIHRNWYQVSDTDAVYAGSTIENGMVAGGTGWAVAMFLNRLADEDRDADGRLHCYDQVRGLWVSYRGGLWIAEGPPAPPQGIWTGIGSRDLLPGAEAAVAALLGAA